MGCFYIFSEGSIAKGPLNFSAEGALPSRFNLSRNNGILQTEHPFQIILMSYDPASATPNRITMMAPGNYAFVDFDRESLRAPYASTELHQHNTFELVYILSGTLYQRIESERHVYPAGSFLLLNRNVRHSEEFDSVFCTVSLSLSPEYFRALLSEDRNQIFGIQHLWGDNTDLQAFLTSELSDKGNDSKLYIDFIPLNFQEHKKDAIEILFEKMIKIMISPEAGDAFFFQGYICQLLNLLCQRNLYTTHPIAVGTQSESRIFSQINTLLEEHHGRISREMLTEKLRYSGNYINRIVQTFTGMSITQYALHFVMKRAAYLLTSTPLSVTDIVTELGFGNRTYFYNAFRKHYGQTPREYRLAHRINK